MQEIDTSFEKKKTRYFQIFYIILTREADYFLLFKNYRRF